MITYIIPKYIDGIGNASLIRDEFGVKEWHTSLNSALRMVFEERRVDLRIVKRKSSKFLNQRNLIPLYLSHDEIFIPIRIRKPLIKRDSGYGYVNMNFIKKVEEGKLILKDGDTLNYIESIRCVKRRLKMAEKIRERYDEKDNLKSLAEVDMSLPATKKDILLLIKEIINLKNEIECMNDI